MIPSEIGTFKEHREYSDCYILATTEVLTVLNSLYTSLLKPARLTLNSIFHVSRILVFFILRLLDKLANFLQASKAHFRVLTHGGCLTFQGMTVQDRPRIFPRTEATHPRESPSKVLLVRTPQHTVSLVPPTTTFAPPNRSLYRVSRRIGRRKSHRTQR